MKNDGIVEIGLTRVEQQPHGGCTLYLFAQERQRRWESKEEEAARLAPKRDAAKAEIAVDLERWNDPVRHAMLVAMAEVDRGAED